MNVLVKHLQERIQEKRRELEATETELNKVQRQRDTIAADLEGYERALGAERRRNGTDGIIAVDTTEQSQVTAEKPSAGKQDGFR